MYKMYVCMSNLRYLQQKYLNITSYKLIHWDNMKKRVKLQWAVSQYRFAELSSNRLPSNKWIPVDTTLSYNTM